MLILLGLLATTELQATDCNKHKIYCKIVKLQPTIDKKFAMKLSNSIYTKAKKYGIDPMISLAILNQESSLRSVNTFTITKKVEENCDNTSCGMKIIEEHEVLDLSIAQINFNTAKAYKFDIKRLFNTDVEYALDCHYALLKDKIKQCAPLGAEAWSCYHSKTPKHRKKYVKAVSRFL